MTPSLAKIKWQNLKKEYDKLLKEEIELKTKAAQKNKAAIKILCDLQRLAKLVLEAGEEFSHQRNTK